MKFLQMLIIVTLLFSCSEETNNNERSNQTDADTVIKKDTEIAPSIESKYNWEELLLTTGYINDVREMSQFQISQLELIKYNFPKIEALAFGQALKICHEYYTDTTVLDSINLAGVHIFNDTTEVIEFYFESAESDRQMRPVVLFKKFKLLGTTYID